MPTALEELERLRVEQGDEVMPASPAMRALRQLREEQEPEPSVARETPAEAGKRARETFQYAVDQGVTLEKADRAKTAEAEGKPAVEAEPVLGPKVAPVPAPDWTTDFYAKMAARSYAAAQDPTRTYWEKTFGTLPEIQERAASFAMTAAEFFAQTPLGAISKQLVLRYALDPGEAATYEHYVREFHKEMESYAVDVPGLGRVNPAKMIMWDIPVFIENLALLPGGGAAKAGIQGLRGLLSVVAQNVMRLGIAGGNTSAAAVVSQGGTPQQAMDAWGVGAAYSAALSALFNVAIAAPALKDMALASLRSRALQKTTQNLLEDVAQLRTGKGSVVKLMEDARRGVELTAKVQPQSAKAMQAILKNIDKRTAAIKAWAAERGITPEQAWREAYPFPKAAAPAAPGAMVPAKAAAVPTVPPPVPPPTVPPATPPVPAPPAPAEAPGPPPVVYHATAREFAGLPSPVAETRTGPLYYGEPAGAYYSTKRQDAPHDAGIRPEGARIVEARPTPKKLLTAAGPAQDALERRYFDIADKIVKAGDPVLEDFVERDADGRVINVLPPLDVEVHAKLRDELVGEGYDAVWWPSRGYYVALTETAVAPAEAPGVAPAPPPAPVVPSDEVGAMKAPTPKQVVSAFKRGVAALKAARGAALKAGVEPAKVTELSLGKGTVADIYRGTRGKTDVAIAEFNARELEAVDITVDELDRHLRENYTPADNENFTVAYRGRPTSGVAQTIAREAEAALPEELKDPKLRAAVQEVSDANYDAGAKVAEQIDAMRRKGPREFQQLEMEDWAEKSLGYFEDYFYGQWDDGPTMTVKEFFTNVWPTTEAWTKHKSIPSPADGVAAGLRLRKPSIVENLRAERISIARMEGAVWERAQAYKNGEGVYVVADTPENRAAYPGWRKLNESVFKDDLFHPDYAMLHDNLISFNKVMTDPALSKFRTFANFARFWRLWIPMFHEINTIKSQVTDFVALMWRTRTPALTPTGLARKLGKDPVFDINKPLYRRYVERGGSHRTSFEYEAMTQVSRWAEGVAKKLIGSNAVNALKWANVLKKFRVYLFDYQIPHIKFTSWAAKVAKREAALGRELTPAEDQEIIKDVQAIYGEMNEALFGRSGTMTSALRLLFTAPGYSEGNFRVQYDAMFHWTGGRGTHARYYIPFALAMAAVIAHLGTRIMAGYWKPWPESANELYDWFFFLDTGVKDDKGRKVGANVGTYEKDFYTILGNVGGAALEAAQGRTPVPELEKIPKRVGKRLTGMTGAFAEVAADLGNIAVGNAIYDYYGNRVMPIYDPFTKKAQKLALHELKRLTPIVGSVYSQARNRGAGRTLAAIEALLGARLTLTQEEREKSERLRTMYALKEDGEKMYRFLASQPEGEIPGLVQEYLENVEDIIAIFPEGEREALRTRFKISRLKNIRRALFGVALSERTPEAKAEATEKILSTLTVEDRQEPKVPGQPPPQRFP